MGECLLLPAVMRDKMHKVLPTREADLSWGFLVGSTAICMIDLNYLEKKQTFTVSHGVRLNSPGHTSLSWPKASGTQICFC
jgi:hypothetical protein